MTHGRGGIGVERLLDLLHGDRGLFDLLRADGLLPEDSEEVTFEHTETARVVGTLVHELEVNWEGAQVVLRMRSELIATRHQVAQLLQMLREQAGSRESDEA